MSARMFMRETASASYISSKCHRDQFKAGTVNIFFCFSLTQNKQIWSVATLHDFVQIVLNLVGSSKHDWRSARRIRRTYLDFSVRVSLLSTPQGVPNCVVARLVGCFALEISISTTARTECDITHHCPHTRVRVDPHFGDPLGVALSSPRPYFE